jgi:hypothetical protein
MTVDVYYCGGYVPLFVNRNYTLLIKYLCVTWCGSVPLDCSYVLLWIDIVLFYFCSDCIEDYQQFIGDNHQLDE